LGKVPSSKPLKELERKLKVKEYLNNEGSNGQKESENKRRGSRISGRH
jgi:hypothetical protein